MSKQADSIIKKIKKNRVLSGVLTVAVVLVLTGYVVHINNGNLHPKSPKSFVGATGTDSLSLSPSSGTYNVGGTLTVTVNETTTTDAINAVEADMTYNSSQLQFVSATCSSTFSAQGQATGGSGTVNLDCATESGPVTGTNAVGTVSFTVLTGGSSTVSFASTCVIVLASNLTNSWNGVTTGGTYTLANAPTVSITNVTASSEIYGSTFPIDTTATAYSGGSITSVQLLLGSTAIQTLTTAPYNFSLNTTVGHPDGSYTINVKATDNQGNTSTASVAVFISNGDLNGAGSVGIFDLTTLASNWGKSGETYAQGNITGHTAIGIYDLAVLASNWGWTKP